MKVKKILAAVLLITVVFTSVGCGKSGETNDDSSSQTTSVTPETKSDQNEEPDDTTNEEITIRFAWWGNTTRNELYNQIVDRFEEDNPGIKVMRESMSYNDYWTKIPTQVAGDNAPDVLCMHPRFTADYANRGALLDLQSFVDNGMLDMSTFPDTIIDLQTFDGKLCTVSMGLNFSCYFVNENLAEEYGVTLPEYNEDWTWEQFLEEADKFVKAAEGSDIYFTGDISTQIDQLRWFARQRGGDVYTYDGELGFEEQTVADYIDLWSDLRDMGAIPDAATATEDYSLALEQKLFTSGKMLIYNAPIGQLYQYAAVMPEYNISAVRIPTDSEGNRAEYLEGAQFAISSTIDAEHQAASAKLINFLVNTERSMELWKMDQGVPANTEMVQYIKPLLDTHTQFAIDYATELIEICTPGVPAAKGGTEVSSLYTLLADGVRFGETDSQSMAAQFMKEAQEILDANK